MKASPDRSPPQSRPKRSRRRELVFRLTAICLPFCCVLLLEGVLRLCGVGYSTRFFLPTTVDGQKMLQDNPRFGWRFFPRAIARTPEPVLFPAHKAPGTVRILVFGESAAMGDPDPAVGLPRLLAAMGEAALGEKKVEVVNVAMTAINSHVIREIARECASLDADFWVIYAGNNEVVGPFGGGTVFSAQAPPLALIRAGLWVKKTRIGQLLNSLRSGGPAEWDGMEMFLRQQVRHDDPRLERVYANFRKNLGEIVAIGTNAGARVILSTVAVNLRECPPFASLQGTNFDAGRLADWDRVRAGAATAATEGRHAEALRALQPLASGSHTHAELRFQIAESALALGQQETAAREFNLAKEFDTLRFRADDTINATIRWIAKEAGNVTFVDAATALNRMSSNSVAGTELFYEHVHFTFEGNYALASLLFAEILKQLPTTSSRPAAVPSEAECAQRLCWNEWKQRDVWTEVQKRLEQPPFTSQLGHRDRLAAIQRRLEGLTASLTPARYRDISAEYRAMLEVRKSDWVVREDFARMLEELGDQTNAAVQWREVARLLPHDATPLFRLGNLADAAGEHEKAIEQFRAALNANPELVEARNGLALALAASGKAKEAIEELKLAVKTRPRFTQARVNLGQLLASEGKTDAARAEYEAVLRLDSNSAPAHVNLGKLLSAAGDKKAAAAHYREALRANPKNTVAHFNLGNALLQEAPKEAVQHYKAAVLGNPGFAEARYALGLELARQADFAGATEQLGEVVKLRPEFSEARFNYGVALAKLRRFDEAAAQFLETLRLDPGNQKAREFLQRATTLRGS